VRDTSRARAAAACGSAVDHDTHNPTGVILEYERRDGTRNSKVIDLLTLSAECAPPRRARERVPQLSFSARRRDARARAPRQH
jgi:hypothetical protein